MLRVLLMIAVLVAAVVLLWFSWHQGRRPFAAACVAVLAVFGVLGVALWEADRNELVALAPSSVRLTVEQVRPLETGLRVSGRIYNLAEHPLARVQARALVRECLADQPCQELASAPLRLQQHVPVGGSYPYSQVVRLPATLLGDQQQVTVEVMAVEGYQQGGV